MNETVTNEQVMTITVFGKELEFTEKSAMALSNIQADEGYLGVEFLSFVDAVMTNLALSSWYRPSESALANALETASSLKDILHELINDKVYGKFN